jgi:hypothetical protein
VGKVKPGVKTTEFWLTVAVDVAALLSALTSALPPKWASAVAGISTGLYALARGWAKSGPDGGPTA